MIDLPFSLKLITGPTVWVAAAADFHIGGDGGARIPVGDIDDDAMILSCIKEATGVMEVIANRIFCSQTFEARYDGFPNDGIIQLPNGPWQSITSVTYYEQGSGTLTTISSADYLFEDASGQLTPLVCSYWPFADRRQGAVQVRYKAGYGDLATDPPIICKRAVVCGVIDELENRNGRFGIPSGVREKLMALWPGTI